MKDLVYVLNMCTDQFQFLWNEQNQMSKLLF